MGILLRRKPVPRDFQRKKMGGRLLYPVKGQISPPCFVPSMHSKKAWGWPPNLDRGRRLSFRSVANPQSYYFFWLKQKPLPANNYQSRVVPALPYESAFLGKPRAHGYRNVFDVVENRTAELIPSAFNARTGSGVITTYFLQNF